MIWLIILVVLAYFSYRYLYSTPHDEGVRQYTETPSIPPVQVPETTTFSPRDQVLRVAESLNWCNDITRICWPKIGKIVELQLGPTIEPLINLYLPKPFSKFRFISADLGKDPLRVDRVTVHRRFHNSIAMDLDVTFLGKPNMTMKVAPLTATFGIKELRWTGRLSVLLRPLITTLPLVGAVQAAMITHPEIDMDFTGIANVADFGPVEKIVRMVLKNVLASVLVLPNRFLYKLSDSVDYFDVYYPPMGIMVVTIERGRGFTKEKKMGLVKATPDLYCKASFGLEDMKTEVRMNNLNPEWGASKPFILSDLEQPFVLKCYDKDAITKDDLVGSISLKAQELLEKESSWHRLQDRVNEKIAQDGEIYLTSVLHIFTNPTETVRGICVVSILIDRASHLPSNTKAASCKVTVGSRGKKVVRETPQITKPNPLIPVDARVDPINPIWNFSFDILCDDYTDADVVIEVLDGKKTLGQVAVDAAAMESTSNNSREENFSLGSGAFLRAKVILHGLAPDKLLSRST